MHYSNATLENMSGNAGCWRWQKYAHIDASNADGQSQSWKYYKILEFAKQAIIILGDDYRHSSGGKIH
jgi:hypothetical protein